MTCKRCWSSSVYVLAALALSTGAGAQPPKVGSEILANSYTSSFQNDPVVAVQSDGSFVVVWASYRDGNQYGIFASRFSSAGTRLASEFQVNTYNPGWQTLPVVAASATGDFVVAWNSADQDGSGTGIFARRFTAAGTPLGVEFQVNVYTFGHQFTPAVLVDLLPSGFIVFSWTSANSDGFSNGVFVRTFFPSGVPFGTEFQANSYTNSGQSNPSLALLANGVFVVAWQSDVQDGEQYGIFAQRFYAGGYRRASEFRVSETTAGNQIAPSVASAANGDFVVAWQGNSGGNSVFARRFDHLAYSFASEFQVNTYTSSGQQRPSLALDPGGAFVVTWQSIGQDGNDGGIFARRFSSVGFPTIGEFQINSFTNSAQTVPSAAAGSGGKYVVAWQSLNQDGSVTGVFAQRLAFPLALDIDGNGSVDALTDTLMAIRYTFGFRGATLISGAVGAGCTRCVATDIEAYLASLTN